MRKRTQARELALQLLYQADQRGDDPAEESAEYLSEKTSDPEIRDFALALLRGCMEQRTELD
ncbi:MAG: transcription antitermination factor NusB, partial [Planctomycetes bacterium]|nr:transcription antitermination factor NusB [Planctomycetota bacterium]